MEDSQVQEILGLIIGFTAVAGGIGIAALAIYLTVPATNKERLISLEARNKERLLLIEKGMDPSIVFKKGAGHDPLLWGLLLSCTALGLFIGYTLSFCFGLHEKLTIYSMAILFGGIGLIAYYIYQKKTDAGKV